MLDLDGRGASIARAYEVGAYFWGRGAEAVTNGLVEKTVTTIKNEEKN